MLLQRLISALILIPIVLLGILKSSILVFIIAILAILALACYEWAGIFRLTKVYKLFYILFIVFSSGGLYFYLGYTSDHGYILNNNLNSIFDIIFKLGLINWIILSILVLVYNFKQEFKVYKIIENNIIVQSLLGLIVLVPFWFCLVYLKSNQLEYFIVVALLLVWFIDSGAYFAGKLFGKHKLIKNVSPGKTWEGLIGGLLFLVLIVTTIYYIFSFYSVEFLARLSLINIIFYSLVVFYFAIFGDLAESMFKRIAKTKDSGHLIPGHGGVLDRLDSFIAIMPVYCMIITSI